MKILWLAGWYPSKVQALSGDFIERHAQASALYNHICVVHVVKDTTQKSRNVVIEKRIYSENLIAFIYYYPSFQNYGKAVDVLISNAYYFWLNLKAFYNYKKKFGRPEGVLVHVGIKAGFVALILYKVWGIPYILFERWVGLFREAKPNFSNEPFLYRLLWKLALKNAKELVTVSKHFGTFIKETYKYKSYSVIPNVINDSLFFPVRKNNQRFSFIHISTLDYQKNFEHILEAFQTVVEKNKNVEMQVYGPNNSMLLDMTEKLGLKNFVTYNGEVSHCEIAKALQSSDALILYSRYEGLANVIIEANACGLPVIVSDFPGFKEIVEEGINGITAKGENPKELSGKILWLISNYKLLDKKLIAERTLKKYNSKSIGQLFDSLYKKKFTTSFSHQTKSNE